MGVQGLWELLAPVGRRVSVETLAGKKLAIDASIWMVQFMKAMRDEKGEMVRNAHILGFFRRICKLLFLRTKPVFVFDGATPALKRRTVAARRRHRDNARAKIRKTAEKLLLNHLKAKRLEELAAEIKQQRGEAKEKPNNDNDSKGKRVLDSDSEIGTEPSGIRPSGDKGSGVSSQENLDELLAASLAAEEDMDISTNVLKHSEGGQGKEGDDDDDEDDESEEMIFPIDNIQLDPAVLASLPPSMQLDLLVQMRERIMAENRQKYQKIKKVQDSYGDFGYSYTNLSLPNNFIISALSHCLMADEVQGVCTPSICSLFTRRFIARSSDTSRKKLSSCLREIDEIQKRAAGRGVAGVQTSRIASEANREFIFSSSFTGDKQFKISTPLAQRIQLRFRLRWKFFDMILSIQAWLELVEYIFCSRTFGSFTTLSGTVKIVCAAWHGMTFQWLYLSILGCLHTEELLIVEIRIIRPWPSQAPQQSRASSLRIGNSYDSDFLHPKRNDDNGMNDDFFMQLVSGGQTSNMPSEGVHSDKITNDSDLAEEINGSPKADYCASKSTLAENPCEEADMDWAEGVCHEPQETFHCQGESEKHVSKGLLEEEADMQEAIRRSLEDFKDHNSPTVSLVNKDLASSFTDRGFDAEISQNLITSVCLDSNSGASLLHNDEQLDNSSKKEDDNIMTSQANNTSPCKPSDELQNHSYLTKPMEGSCNVNSNTNSKAMDNNSIMVLGLSIPDGQNIIEKTNIASNFMVDQSMENTLSYPIEVSEASLDNEISLLRQERADLGNEQRILERNAESVNNEMFAECQELLQMFGLPYIIAPTEAEAQCAYMEMTKLVDGVVTDDSDVFLFGARSVFKNIFDDRKYVETYFMKDIESELGLNRENLIRMAMLLGSDYTEGVRYVRLVNFLRILNILIENQVLFKEFCKILSKDSHILISRCSCNTKIGIGIVNAIEKSKKESSKENNDANLMKESVEGDAIKNPSGNGAVKDIFMDKHRNVSKNWHISPSFPSDAVINAYTSPQIDESTEPFMWGKPDLPLLRKLCWEKFGWTNQKADELLVPVLKEYNKHETQLRLEAFYTFNERFAKIRSQRIKKALKGMTDNLSPELTDDLVKEAPSSSRKIAKVSQEHIPENSSGHNFKRRKTRKQSIAQESGKEIVDPDAVVEDSLNSEQCKVVDNNFLSVNKTGKEGRGRGRGRGRDNSRRKSVLKSDSECSNNGKNNDSIGDIQVENQAEVPRAILELRRSSRLLKQVKYAEDFGADENEDCPSREHLFSGGGFCVDENDGKDNMDQIAANQTHGSTEIHFEDRHGDASYDLQHALEEASCGDYLLSGGGFCIDENNERVVATQSAITNIRDLELAKNSEDPENIGSDNFEKDDSNKELDPQFHSVLDENISLHSCGQTNSGLSAMSSLRRKPRRR
ncbi:hypothetical protein ZIOFF_036704 [Zingiber officinale]|uniref:DNA repair protein UVH3 n=1 Tax=Zingiber officinale TaxID=94328 RepID=A0A8J5L3M7_ZINOF|nr:hypothetical protein ZIOFF_036704 [Zingiber officinale]